MHPDVVAIVGLAVTIGVAGALILLWHSTSRPPVVFVGPECLGRQAVATGAAERVRAAVDGAAEAAEHLLAAVALRVRVGVSLGRLCHLTLQAWPTGRRDTTVAVNSWAVVRTPSTPSAWRRHGWRWRRFSSHQV